MNSSVISKKIRYAKKGQENIIKIQNKIDGMNLQSSRKYMEN